MCIRDSPKPGHGQVLIQTKATTICGSDIRCIYREHVGKGPEGYIPGMVAGHEPCGVIVEEGEGLKRFKKGDRVIVYHISCLLYTSLFILCSLRVRTICFRVSRETILLPISI